MKFRKISLYIVMLLFCIFSTYSNGKKDLEISKDILDFLNTFYENRKSDFTYTKLQAYFFSPQSWAEFNEFYRGGRKTIYIPAENGENEFYLFQNKILALGSFNGFNIVNSEYKKAIYDISEGELYCIGIEVCYDYKKTYENFWLKKMEDSFFIYYYSINISNIS